MSPSNPLLDESKQRLAHLRTLPLTEPRKREILSLERVLAEAPRQAREPQRPGRPARPRAYGKIDEEETAAAPPSKRVERQQAGHKKVTLRVSRPETHKDEEKDDERDRKERLKNTLSVLGLTRRGMS
jgi:hypothetical protein